MNQLQGILLGFVLISGSIFTPYSFAETSDYSDGPYSSFFKLLQYLFSSGDVTIITNSNSILDFDKAVIILASSTSTDPTDDEFEDESEDDDDFHHGIVSVSSETSVEKITLCHVTGNHGSHSISVANPSISAHLAHGDYLGTCDSDDNDDSDDQEDALKIHNNEKHKEKEHKEKEHKESKNKKDNHKDD